MSNATCGTCPYYCKFTDEVRDEIYLSMSSWVGYEGTCRIGRPQTIGDDSKGVWPATTGDAWCGEHPDRKENNE